jgi:hypothetical protein
VCKRIRLCVHAQFTSARCLRRRRRCEREEQKCPKKFSGRTRSQLLSRARKALPTLSSKQRGREKRTDFYCVRQSYLSMTVTAAPRLAACRPSERIGSNNSSSHHTNLNGISRNGLPVARRSAFASAGANGGRPGSPTPFGGSLLGTMCTAIFGMSVMRGIG